MSELRSNNRISGKRSRLSLVSHLVLLCLVLFLCTLSLTGCSQTPEQQQQSGIYFDTAITITLYVTEDPKGTILASCFELAGKYEALFSKTLEGSDVWNINHGNAAAVSCDPETIYLLNYALTIAENTDGRIDPTIEPLSSLWDFSSVSAESGLHVPPEETAIREALSHVNHEQVVIQDTNVTLTDPSAGIDLGFVAKGYIADRILEYLKTKDNVSGAVINLGGNVVFYGTKPSGQPYNLGIQKPFADTGTPMVTTSWRGTNTVSAGTNSATENASGEAADSVSFVTSGIYERCYTYEDTLYHHILDTTTGYPVRTDVQGVTILSSSSMEGDALSTTCLILGAEKGLSYIESLDEVEALFILDNGEIRTTSGFPEYALP